jgi:hypothetical protein
VHLLERGYAVRLLTDTGLSVPEAGTGETGGSVSETSGLLLDTLAVVQLSEGAGLSRAEDVLRLGGEGLVVAVLGALDEQQVAQLGRLRRRTGAAVAFLLDTGTWTGLRHVLPTVQAADVDTQERLLREAGWTVLRVRAGDSAAALWRHADRMAQPGTGQVPSFTAGGLPRTDGEGGPQ